MAKAYYRYIRWTITARKGGGSGNIQAADFELMDGSNAIAFDIPAARGAASALFPVGSQSWRYLRWTITETRDTGSGTCQCAEFRLYSGGSTVSWPVGTTVTNPSGTVVDPVANLIDGNSGSKWGDSAHNANGQSVIHIDTTATGVSFDSYQIVTGNDAVGRDPFVWLLEGSNDNSSWTTVDDHPYATGLPTSGSERVQMLLDENSGTKFNDSTFNGTSASLIFEWNRAYEVGFDGYRYRTANDVEARDPVSWTLEGSQDGSTWVALDTRTSETITSSRSTYTSTYAITSPQITKIYLAADISGGTIAIPSDYNSASNSWHAIGGSPDATDPGAVGGGGVGGGAWARTDNISLTAGGTASAQIGLGDVWVSNTGSAPTANTEGVLAKAGVTNSGTTGGAGGAAASCVGNASASGGAGGNSVASTNQTGGGGGGAGGPHGAGGAGGAVAFGTGGGGGGGANGGAGGATGISGPTSGGAGGNNRLGTGSGSGGATGGGTGSNGGGGGGKGGSSAGVATGSTDVLWTDNSGGTNNGQTAGPGSGGGGGRNALDATTAVGGQGGLYGGGAGGSGEDATAWQSGRNGVLVLIYEPATGGGSTYTLTADVGSLEVAGQAATFGPLVMPAAQGTLEIAGQVAITGISRRMEAAQGALEIAGQDATFRRSYNLVAEPATLTVAGQDATTIPPNQTLTLTAEPGLIAISGQAAQLNTVMPAAQATLEVAGQAATTRYNRVLAAAPALIEIAGQAATTRRTHVMQALFGLLEVDGQNAGLIPPGGSGNVGASTWNKMALDLSISL